MLFNSVAYLIFLPAILLLYYLLPHRFRWVLLLLGSYFFYGYWEVNYLLLIILSTVIDYSLSNYLVSTDDSLKRKAALFISLCSNLGILFFFKYSNFFLGELAQLSDPKGTNQSLNDLLEYTKFLLPVGISFYTFQTMGYTIDVYNRQTEPERHLGKFALFVSFFPQLVAGPIERFSNLQPQLLKNQLLKYENLARGFRLILFGMFVKMTIADNLAGYVDIIFEDPKEYHYLSVITGVLFFGFQIYADFYGYSLIAIGSAQLLGIHIMDNFNAPYFSRSIIEFWHRWHISLSTWFRDYLYIPLGGNRVNALRWSVNILAVFILSGIWHGANWTYLIWGGIHGLIYLVERFLKWPAFTSLKIMHPFLLIKTYLIVNLAWVFFRSDSLDHAITMLSSCFPTASNATGESLLNIDPITVALLLVFLVVDYGLKDTRFDHWCSQRSIIVRWSTYALLIYLIMTVSGTVNHPFIYFQF